jgi:hypothetical protein
MTFADDFELDQGITFHDPVNERNRDNEMVLRLVGSTTTA